MGHARALWLLQALLLGCHPTAGFGEPTLTAPEAPARPLAARTPLPSSPPVRGRAPYFSFQLGIDGHPVEPSASTP